MSGLVTWRALQACHVDGVYREAGEVFMAPDGEYDPAVREKMGGQCTAAAKAGAAGKGKGPAKAPGVMPDDLPPLPDGAV